MKIPQPLKDTWYFFAAVRDGNYDPQSFRASFPKGLIFATLPGETYVVRPSGQISRPIGQSPLDIDGTELLALGALPLSYANQLEQIITQVQDKGTVEMINAQREARKILNLFGRRPQINPELKLVATLPEGPALRYRTPARIFDPITKLIALN